jgi:hypothetical protein
VGRFIAQRKQVTFRPAAASALAVPPVEISSTPSFAKDCAKSTRPVLSETESSARRTGRRFCVDIGGAFSFRLARAQ